MEKGKKRLSVKVLSLLNLVLGLVMIGAVKVWSPVCGGMLPLASGGETHMACFYFGQAVVVLGILLAVNGVTLFLTGQVLHAGLLSLVIGVSAFLLLAGGPMKIGICANTAMSCTLTAGWVKMSAGAVFVMGLVSTALAVKRRR